MTDELKQKFTMEITRANSTKLVVILYDMLLVYLDECEEALESDGDEFTKALERARGCLNELLNSTNVKYAPGENIKKLLFFCVRRLARTQRDRTKAPIEDIKKVVKPLRDAFEKISDQNTSGPVMGNSQDIYVGLTYGKRALNENLTDQGSNNRGMRV